MAVFSIWESRFPPERAEEGLGVTRAIWEDMLGFAGYLDHEVVRDLDDPGHLIVVSRWESREAADEALELYRENSNAVRANELVSEPRRRVVGTAVGTADPGGAPGGRASRELGWASGGPPAPAPRGTLSLPRTPSLLLGQEDS